MILVMLAMVGYILDLEKAILADFWLRAACWLHFSKKVTSSVPFFEI